MNTRYTISIAVLVGLAIITGYFLYSSRQKPQTTVKTQVEASEFILSSDKKSISHNNTEVLSIDNDTIFDWFKTESQLCNETNIESRADRKQFCEDKNTFKNQSRFTTATPSPDNQKVGFTIESDTLTPDTVAGIFSVSKNQVNILTNYYLGNEFISFSPTGKNFVLKGNCFEGKCALFIGDSETFEEKTIINNEISADARAQDVMFEKWISDTEAEYKVGTELKRVSF